MVSTKRVLVSILDSISSHTDITPAQAQDGDMHIQKTMSGHMGSYRAMVLNCILHQDRRCEQM